MRNRKPSVWSGAVFIELKIQPKKMAGYQLSQVYHNQMSQAAAAKKGPVGTKMDFHLRCLRRNRLRVLMIVRNTFDIRVVIIERFLSSQKC